MICVVVWVNQHVKYKLSKTNLYPAVLIAFSKCVLFGEFGELLIMPANGRWDLIQRLKD